MEKSITATEILQRQRISEYNYRTFMRDLFKPWRGLKNKRKNEVLKFKMGFASDDFIRKAILQKIEELNLFPVYGNKAKMEGKP